jgi:hypothetical protein
MNLRAAFRALGWLVRDTFSQSRGSGIFWLLLGASLAGVGVCLFAPLPDAEAAGALRLGLAAWGAGGAGLFLALVCTAGFLPSFLRPEAASVLLAKPVPRVGLFAGKFLGVLALVAFFAAAFVLGTWLALAARTGDWGPDYLWTLPLILWHFAVFFSFSALLAAATRSTVACLFGTVLFWLLCGALNFGRHALRALPGLDGLAGTSGAVEAGYWLLPKPLDFHLVLLQALPGEQALAGPVDFHTLASRGAWAPGMSLLASSVCAAVLLALAAYEFATADY